MDAIQDILPVSKQPQTVVLAKQSEKKPLEMNTYIQLEMDSSNFNCVPRVCKFGVKKLNLQTDFSTSVILAVKLEVSKRSLRTVEIPLTKSSTDTSFADLNLNYCITYPHFLKKDSNTLYFYIQRRKKYKTRTILGYKTLAFSFIDLASVLQRPFSKDLPLYLKANATSNKMTSEFSTTLSSVSHSNLKNSNNKIVIGSLNIHMLVSQPFEMTEAVDNNFSYFRNTTDALKNELDDVFDDYDEFNEYLLSNKESKESAASEKLKSSRTRMSLDNNGEALGTCSVSDNNANARKRSNAAESVFFPSDSDNENETEKKNDEVSSNHRTLFYIFKGDFVFKFYFN